MEKVVCHETLGGLLKHYDEGQHERLAAFPFPAILQLSARKKLK